MLLLNSQAACYLHEVGQVVNGAIISNKGITGIARTP